MNIVKETKHLLGRTELSRNMTDEELKAYTIGVNNTLRAVKVILDSDEHIVVNVKNQDSITKILDMVPDVIDKFTSKDKDKVEVEEVEDIDDIINEAK